MLPSHTAEDHHFLFFSGFYVFLNLGLCAFAVTKRSVLRFPDTQMIVSKTNRPEQSDLTQIYIFVHLFLKLLGKLQTIIFGIKEIQ